MLYLVLITLGLLLAGTLLLLPIVKGVPPADEAESAVAAEPMAIPTTLEGALVAQLVAGAITRAQYRAALARLAERDDERHPMSVPDSDR